MNRVTARLLAGLLLVHAISGGAAGQTFDPARNAIEPIARIAYEPIGETSGLARSGGGTNLFWALNDSLNPPDLFLIDRTGRCLAQVTVQGAENLDWEALASDGQATLYIGDIGNNIVKGGLPARRVYWVREPDLAEVLTAPATQPVRRELPVQGFCLYRFPEGPFDAEAMFARQGRLYIVSKAGRGSTRLWQVDISAPGQGRPLRMVCDLPDLHSVTDASLSPDGRRLALCSYEYVAIYDLDPREPIETLGTRQPTILSLVPPLHRPTTIEACCWSSNTELLLAGENRSIHAVRVPSPASQLSIPVDRRYSSHAHR